MPRVLSLGPSWLRHIVIAILMVMAAGDPFTDAILDNDCDDWIPEQHMAIIEPSHYYSVTRSVVVLPVVMMAIPTSKERFHWTILNDIGLDQCSLDQDSPPIIATPS